MPRVHVTLPAGFRHIRLELAREPGHPEGSGEIGYAFFAPLRADGTIDAEAWKTHRTLCRAARMRPSEDPDIGHLVRRPGGSWAFRYDIVGDEDDEAGYRFGEHAFRVGEYVTIHEDDGEHTYRVVSVQEVRGGLPAY